MIQKNHKVNLVVNNQMVELENEKSLNLRMNNIIYDPTKISSTQAEYSFSFDIPITPKNTRIFDFANILSKVNKFTKLYEAVVYGDGNEIFRGQLKIASIDGSKFKCNLVSVKVNKIEDIFGDSTMNQISWYVPYEGIDTIDSVNKDMTTDYYFPLVCYGVFQKKPRATYANEYNAYTSKYLFDKYNLWYPETFTPSVKLTELIKKMFEQKGYNVTGDIFEDDIAKDIYLSTHLADKQIPIYNLGNPTQGAIEVNFKMWTGKTQTTSHGSSSVSVGGLSYNLTYPYDYAGYVDGSKTYNFTQVTITEAFNTAYRYQASMPHDQRVDYLYGTEFSQNNDNMYRDGYIVIPADGAYKIEMDIDIDISDNKAQEGALFYEGGKQVQKTVSHSWEGMPVEVQLTRNCTDTELIHGFDGKVYSVYPHEAPNTAQTNTTGTRPSGTGSGGTRPGNMGQGSGGNRGRRSIKPYGVYESDPDTPDPEDFNMGFMPKQGFMLCYDQLANPNFICGFSSIGNCPSVIKNGYSWSSETDTEMHSRYNCGGYYGVNWDSTNSEYNWKSTTFNSNNYPGAPLDLVQDNGAFKKKGHVSCVVWLNRNDMLSLKVVERKYEGATYTESEWPNTERQYYPRYYSVVSGSVKVSAYSPNAGDLTSTDLNYNNDTKFDKQLNLGQFLNKDVKQSDFINNFIKAFNLTVQQNGNNVNLNKNYIDFNRMLTPINLDNRVYNKNITIEPIDYPSSMRINYNIDDEEAGFYNSVPYPEINYDNWKDYADVGSEKVQLTSNEDAQESDVTLTNSYTWYANFKYNNYADDNTTILNVINLSLPIISKDEWMIENYKYEESMKVDGKGLPQRWWFRQPVNMDVQFETVNNAFVNPSIPINTKDGFTLNYKNDDNTLLTRYFNITAYTSSDMIEFECYLSPDEYILLKKGAPIQINSDIYYTCSITGFDPSGLNAAKIKAMKKV